MYENVIDSKAVVLNVEEETSKREKDFLPFEFTKLNSLHDKIGKGYGLLIISNF